MAEASTAETDDGANPRDLFVHKIIRSKPAPVLEYLTPQTARDASIHHMYLFPHIERKDFVIGGGGAGPDVDEICDLHKLPAAWEGRFQAFVAVAVLEHCERPWLAAKEMFNVLAPGGLCYVATHQCFPLHGSPRDFFRFSREALELLFRDAGFDILASRYEDRCKIVPPTHILPPGQIEAWNMHFPSFVNVHLLAQKAAPRPPARPVDLGDPLSLVRSSRAAVRAKRQDDTAG